MKDKENKTEDSWMVLLGKCRKLWTRLLRRIFRPPKKTENTHEQQTSLSSVTYGHFVDRFRRDVCSLRYYNRRKGTIREMEVQSFSDAVYFLLKLCGSQDPEIVHHSNYIEYIIRFPFGTISLVDKGSNVNSRIVGRLYVNIPVLADEVSEIRFKIK